jgi:hydroxymethylglutaryl-CoA synthase
MHAAIHAVGRYIPRFRIRAETIAHYWKREPDHPRALGIIEKAVASHDEDTLTMAFEAAEQALVEWNGDRKEIGALFVGSESHPYAVKPTSGMLVSALGVNPFCRAADLEFACKAGTAAMQIVESMVTGKTISFGLAIGSDRAQSKPGDALEYSAAAGAAAILIGPSTAKKPGLCRIDASLSYTTDTPDFWRTNDAKHPTHAGRFTGEPAYFHHVETAAKEILTRTNAAPTDIHHVIFHMPNAKFPNDAARRLGFSDDQMKYGFIVPSIGNTYSACSLLGLTFALEHAKKDERILVVSYGSGSGADAFLLTMMRDGTPLPPQRGSTHELTYAEYRSLTEAYS